MKDDELRAPKELGLGATGEFPDGKITPGDEGQLRMAIRAFPEKGIVAVDFGKQISWLGLDQETAIDLGNALLRQAAQLPSAADHPKPR